MHFIHQIFILLLLVMLSMGKKNMKISTCTIFFLTFLAFLLHVTIGHDGEDGRFDYVIASDNRAGNGRYYHGHSQSPIDIVDEKTIRREKDLKSSYRPKRATIMNEGHEIKVNLEGAGEINIDGTQYLLQQCHWHSPSEHKINGWRYPLELHMVHLSNEGNIAVVGVLYNIGLPDPFLIDLTDGIRSISGMIGAEIEVDFADPNKAISWKGWPYYRYNGSLTTPPYTEGVVWTVREHVQSVSHEQVKLLREAINNVPNARPVQPINGRDVYHYRPVVHHGSFSS